MKGTRILEEGRDTILNRVVMIGPTEKINLNKDLKGLMAGAMQISGEERVLGSREGGSV